MKKGVVSTGTCPHQLHNSWFRFQTWNQIQYLNPTPGRSRWSSFHLEAVLLYQTQNCCRGQGCFLDAEQNYTPYWNTQTKIGFAMFVFRTVLILLAQTFSNIPRWWRSEQRRRQEVFCSTLTDLTHRLICSLAQEASYAARMVLNQIYHQAGSAVRNLDTHFAILSPLRGFLIFSHVQTRQDFQIDQTCVPRWPANQHVHLLQAMLKKWRASRETEGKKKRNCQRFAANVDNNQWLEIWHFLAGNFEGQMVHMVKRPFEWTTEEFFPLRSQMPPWSANPTPKPKRCVVFGHNIQWRKRNKWNNPRNMLFSNKTDHVVMMFLLKLVHFKLPDGINWSDKSSQQFWRFQGQIHGDGHV